MASKITVKCIYCGRIMDGYLVGARPNEIVRNLGDLSTLAVAAEYGRKMGYMHVACHNGLEAQHKLNEERDHGKA